MRFGCMLFRKRTDQPHLNIGNFWWYRTLSTILLLAPTVLLIGCAGLVSAGGTKSQSGQQAAIQVTPGSFNFGNLIVGRKVSQTATVANTGNTSINVTAASVSSGQFAVSGITMPLSLPAGQSSTFQVWFDPSAAGTVTGTLTIQTANGVSSGQIALTGIATTPPQQISVSSTALNLGSAVVGTTTNGSLNVTNTGGANLIISLISVNGGPFGVSGITTPSTIVPGSSATVNVSFTPTTAGSDSGSISIISNDPNSPTTTVNLTGIATTSAVAPTITTQPVNQTVTAGQTATFTVVAGGTAPLSYQWQKNGVNVAGATASSY
ncbi:MAG TPA: choice-of-anchor D domain-containing protein, partial [Candidatus Acidoferrum sp.]